jgi:hypothetical protein
VKTGPGLTETIIPHSFQLRSGGLIATSANLQTADRFKVEGWGADRIFIHREHPGEDLTLAAVVRNEFPEQPGQPGSSMDPSWMKRFRKPYGLAAYAFGR